MNYLSFNHESQDSWLNIAPKLVAPLKMEGAEGKTISIEPQDPVVFHTTDDRLNYIIGSMGEELDMKRKIYDDHFRPDYDAFDYKICDDNNKHISDVGNRSDHTPPMSFFAIDNVADGIEWYRNKYPQMPDIVCETCAREKWGTIPKNRGEIRAEKKALVKAKKKEEKNVGLTIKRGTVSVPFN